MIDNVPSNPAPVPRPTGDFVDAAREFSTAYCHGVNTENAKHQREHDAAMRRMELDAAAIAINSTTVTTERQIKWAVIGLIGVVLGYGMFKSNDWLISQTISLLIGLLAGALSSSKT
jgi:hypothetical protein